jgi:hypothetical protein
MGEKVTVKLIGYEELRKLRLANDLPDSTEQNQLDLGRYRRKGVFQKPVVDLVKTNLFEIVEENGERPGYETQMLKGVEEAVVEGVEMVDEIEHFFEFEWIQIDEPSDVGKIGYSSPLKGMRGGWGNEMEVFSPARSRIAPEGEMRVSSKGNQTSTEKTKIADRVENKI